MMRAPCSQSEPKLRRAPSYVSVVKQTKGGTMIEWLKRLLLGPKLTSSCVYCGRPFADGEWVDALEDGVAFCHNDNQCLCAHIYRCLCANVYNAGEPLIANVRRFYR